MFLRRFQTFLGANGSGSINVTMDNTAKEWVIRQVSVTTATANPNCVCALYFNDSYLHHTPLGSLDSATGPPYPILGAGDVLMVRWTGGTPGDQATVNLYHDEVFAGTGGMT